LDDEIVEFLFDFDEVLFVLMGLGLGFLLAVLCFKIIK
jgi:hypothetical protein